MPKIKNVFKWVNWVEKNIYPWIRLPSAYQEVEYIEGSWTQYIDTGVKAGNTLSTKIVMRPNMSYTSEYAIFWDSWAANALFLMEYQWKYRLHNWGNYWDFANVTNVKTTIETSPTWIKINGTSYSLNAGSSYSNNNIRLFSVYGDSTSTRWHFKVYSFQIYNNWTLIRDLVPCYRKSDSVIWMYDLVNNVFYTNAGSWTFVKWPEILNMSQIQKVEYIQSSWTQYIKTWLLPSTNYLKTYMKVIPLAVSSSSADYRAWWAYSSNNRMNVHYIGYGQGRLYAWFGWWDYNTGITMSANTLYEITMTANNGSYSVTMNNTTVTWTYSGTVAVGKDFWLFCNDENWSMWASWQYKMYSFKAETSDWTVRDFIPCYKKSDGVIWLYDKINKTFYTNSWSGTFTKWPNI